MFVNVGTWYIFDEFETFDVDRFRVDIGDTSGGDVDSGELGMSGDTLLLLEIGGLEDQTLEEFSLRQAGIFRFPVACLLKESFAVVRFAGLR